jgi:2-succinyl-5-enolpyruvyl-6-hydroxy-3-cyclohexene-1-carboxylate synthase
MFSVVDERSAGFLALGIGKASRRPAVVITTSGTAGANLYPAVIEASQGEVPLLVLTADRPHRLRDTDANQSMDQIRLFGVFARGFFEIEPPVLEDHSVRHLRSVAARAFSLTQGASPGPVHINFPFEKPLEPSLDSDGLFEDEEIQAFRKEHPGAGLGRTDGEPYVRVVSGPSLPDSRELQRIRAAVEGARRGLIVAGPTPNPQEVGPAVLNIGALTGFPVLADPLSGARFTPPRGAFVVGGYDLFLRSNEARVALAPDLVLRVGGSPTSAALLSFLGEFGEARQIVVDQGFRWKDHLATAHDYVDASPPAFFEVLSSGINPTPVPGWLDLWREAEERTSNALEGRGPGELLEGEVLAAVTTHIPEGANLFVASSMPIRDLDAFCFPGSGSGMFNVYGNRGVSGIDGLVSTTVGVAVGSNIATKEWDGSTDAGPKAHGPEGSALAPITVGVLGDLAFFHDMNGLLALKTIQPRVVLVVINNDGGGIFETLPVREHEPAFSEFFSTPHGLDFGKAADLYGVPYSRVTSVGEFQEAFPRLIREGGPSILEVRTNRRETHQHRRAVVGAVVEAMNGLGEA